MRPARAATAVWTSSLLPLKPIRNCPMKTNVRSSRLRAPCVGAVRPSSALLLLSFRSLISNTDRLCIAPLFSYRVLVCGRGRRRRHVICSLSPKTHTSHPTTAGRIAQTISATLWLEKHLSVLRVTSVLFPVFEV